MTSALLVIDMQQGSFTDATPRHDSAGLVDRLNRLAASVRDSAGLVIFVQHDGPPGDPHEPGRPGWHILKELAVRGDDALVRKSSCDAFLGTGLEQLLHARQIDHLIVTGCATDFCVDTTVRSALARGFRTTAPSDGHTTADRPHLPATAIIAHHNAIWADFLSPGGAADVRPCAAIRLD